MSDGPIVDRDGRDANGHVYAYLRTRPLEQAPAENAAPLPEASEEE